MTENDRAFWMIVRQALIMVLGAIEDRLGLPRSIVPRRKRDGHSWRDYVG